MNLQRIFVALAVVLLVIGLTSTVLETTGFIVKSPKMPDVETTVIKIPEIQKVESPDETQQFGLLYTNDTLGWCECSNCSDCTAALNDNENCTIGVKLTQNITAPETCIAPSTSFNNKVFDCQGYNITGPNSGINYGFNLSNNDNNTIQNCNIFEFQYGIYLLSSSNNTLTNNTVNNNTNYGVYFTVDSTNNTINYTTACNNTVTDINDSDSNTFSEITCDTDFPTNICNYSCSITPPSGWCNCTNCSDCTAALNDNDNCTIGVKLTQNITSPGTCINNSVNFTNKIFDCQGYNITGPNSGTNYGIYLNGKTNNVITNCNIFKFQRGIYLYLDSNNNTLINNTVNNNINNGINLLRSSNNTLTNNTANNNFYGISLQTSSNNNTLTNNTANYNTNYGVYFTVDSTNNTISYTTACNNTPTDINDLDSNIFLETTCDSSLPAVCNYTCPLPPGVCKCNNCTNCANALNNNLCLEVKLTQDITASGTCIDNPANFTNKTFDCQGYNITGPNSGYGLKLSGKNNNTIKNCNIFKFQYGIGFYSSSKNNTLINNTANYNTNYGVYFTVDSTNNTINYTTACNNTVTDINDLDSNTFLETTCDSSSHSVCDYVCPTLCECNSCPTCSVALSNNSCSEVKLTQNITATGTCISNPANFINKIFDCQGYNITGPNSGMNYGIYLNGKTNNIIKNCNIFKFQYGIRLDSSSNNNTFTNNTASNNTFMGIYVVNQSNYNTLSNNIAYNNSMYGIYIYNSWNNNLINNIAYKNSQYGIYLRSSLYNTLVNNKVYNNSIQGLYIYSDSTDNKINYTLACYNLNVDITNSGSSNTFFETTCDFSSPAVCDYACPVSVADCMNLTIPNKVYTLFGNILGNQSGTSNCINVQANNVTLDCDEYTLIGNESDSSGIYVSGYNKTTIRNCIISNYNYGIYLYSSSNNTLTNNTVNNNSFEGILIYSYSNNNTLSNNIAYNNIWHGIRLYYSSNNILTNNTAYNNNKSGVYTYSSLNNTLINNTANNNSDHGIYLSQSSNNILTNNTANNNSDHGIYLYYSSNNNTLTNNTAKDNTQYGVYFTSDSTDNIINYTTACNNTVTDINDSDSNTFSEITCDTDFPTNICNYSCSLADGQICALNSDCASGNCADDYDGVGSWCAAVGSCAHDATNYASSSSTCNSSYKLICSSGSWGSTYCSNGCSSGTCLSDGGSSGSGTGGAPAAGAEAIWSEGTLEKQMSVKDKIKFTIGGENHTILLITMGTNYVVLNISSNTTILTININETKEVDITADNLSDISVKLNKIELGKAYFTFTKLGYVVAQPPIGETLPSVIYCGDGICQQTESCLVCPIDCKTCSPTTEVEKPSSTIYIIIFVGALAATIFAIVYFKFFRGERELEEPEKQQSYSPIYPQYPSLPGMQPTTPPDEEHELDDYVNRMLKRGVSEANIVQALRNVRWPEPIIKRVMVLGKLPADIVDKAKAYVKSAIQRGMSKEMISQRLANKGWPAETINEILNA